MSLYFQNNFDVDTLGGQKNTKEKKKKKTLLFKFNNSRFKYCMISVTN